MWVWAVSTSWWHRNFSAPSVPAEAVLTCSVHPVPRSLAAILIITISAWLHVLAPSTASILGTPSLQLQLGLLSIQLKWKKWQSSHGQSIHRVPNPGTHLVYTATNTFSCMSKSSSSSWRLFLAMAFKYFGITGYATKCSALTKPSIEDITSTSSTQGELFLQLFLCQPRCGEHLLMLVQSASCPSTPFEGFTAEDCDKLHSWGHLLLFMMGLVTWKPCPWISGYNF